MGCRLPVGPAAPVSSFFLRASCPQAASISEPFSRLRVCETPFSARIFAKAALLAASLRFHGRDSTLL